MKKFLSVIFMAVIAMTVFMNVNRRGFASPLSGPLLASASVLDETDSEAAYELWIDTVMYADGHAFGYSGDISMWGGWYFDTTPVGDDRMLTCDSVGPSTLRLNLVTRQLNVDLGCPDAADRIKAFLAPIDGFKRFQKKYKVCLDSVEDKEYGTLKCMGYFSIIADYADSDNENADKLNRFICDLTDVSNSERVKIPALSAFYAGYHPTKNHRTSYTGESDDMPHLSDFIANRTFDEWREEDLAYIGSMAADLAIRASIVTPKFVTFSMYEYEREGVGHGGYTQTFHTLDLESGKRLSNDVIFNPHTLDQVKWLLFDVMANDRRYTEWNPDIESAEDVASRIDKWQSPNPVLEGTEWEEPKRDSAFELPGGALTNSGVVFSFQPYEINCWAAGAFHFIIPYKKLMPYLTPKVRGMIRG